VSDGEQVVWSEPGSDRGAEFVVRGALPNESDRLPNQCDDVGDRLRRYMGQGEKARELGVPRERRLDVEGHVVHEPVSEQGAKDGGTGPVRVELDAEAKLLHLPEEEGEVAVEGRFAPGDDEPVEEPRPLGQGCDHHVQGKAGEAVRQPRQDELSVVAERAAEVAAHRPHHRAHLPRVVEEGEGLEMGDLHS